MIQKILANFAFDLPVQQQPSSQRECKNVCQNIILFQNKLPKFYLAEKILCMEPKIEHVQQINLNFGQMFNDYFKCSKSVNYLESLDMQGDVISFRKNPCCSSSRYVYSNLSKAIMTHSGTYFSLFQPLLLDLVQIPGSVMGDCWFTNLFV